MEKKYVEYNLEHYIAMLSANQPVDYFEFARMAKAIQGDAYLEDIIREMAEIQKQDKWDRIIELGRANGIEPFNKREIAKMAQAIIRALKEKR